MKIGMKCWYGQRPGVIIGGGDKRARVRYVDAKGGFASINWANLSQRNGQWKPWKKPKGKQ